MTTKTQVNKYSAFEGVKLLYQGELSDVVLKIKKYLGATENSAVLLFSDDTGKTMDFNFHGTKQEVLKRLEIFTSSEEPKSIGGPGRPRLGVISREVSLLPRHWEWLATQSGGSSATLRNLVEEAQKKSSNTTSMKQVQERVYRVMSVLAGDLPGYEEALRALYKRDRKTYLLYTETWPKDVQKYLIEIGAPVFQEN